MSKAKEYINIKTRGYSKELPCDDKLYLLTVKPSLGVSTELLPDYFRNHCLTAISIQEEETKEKAISILEDFIAEGLLITLEDNIINSFKELLNGE